MTGNAASVLGRYRRQRRDRPHALSQCSLTSAISGPPAANWAAIRPTVLRCGSYGTSIFTGGYLAPSKAAASKKSKISGSSFGVIKLKLQQKPTSAGLGHQ